VSFSRDDRFPGLAETIQRQRRGLDGLELLVGLPGSDSASGENTASELVEIGRALEYGTATIPPRPFLRTALKRHRRRWSNGLDAVVPFAGRGDTARLVRVLRRVGVAMVGDTQATIRKGPWAPNAPATIRQKGSAMPLIDTGQLVQSIRAVVKRHGKQVEVIG
jgi:hypothetical protein